MTEENTNSVWKLIQDLSNKRGITEIAINDLKKVFVEREGQFIQLKANLLKEDLDEFISDVCKINEKVCNRDNPILDGSLPDGSRINIILPPYVDSDAAITIRKYLKTIKDFDQVDDSFGISESAVPFFKALVKSHCNIIVSGGTGVGKTTFLNLLLNEVNEQERVITIEDTYELNTKINNLVKLISRTNSWQENKGLAARDLVKNSLRMRPDRIIIGEVRGEEVFDLLQAMNTGHSGSMSSVHANSARESIKRLETLFLLAGFDISISAVRYQISMAIDFIIHLSKDKDGERIVAEVLEITGADGDTIQSQKIAEYKDGRLIFTGLAPSCIERLSRDGDLPLDYFS